MRRYAQNSPEAMARVIAMILLADGDLDDDEVEMLDRLGVYDRLDVDRETFIRVVQEYFDDLLEYDAGDRISLLDAKRVDLVLDCVDGNARRSDLAALMLRLVSADGHMNDAELATLRHVLKRWDLTLEEIEAKLQQS